ncbi:MAG: exodeoxyribonuclease VII large subunit [Crocinitomicaceae bacterium]|nr:exodeoxyribonuclease VII large subunit [Crocinitomicaceae bacterium]
MNEQRQIFTLRQVVSSIRKTIEERYQRTYWIKAEMHKLNLYPSGHAFPELVHKEDGKIVAQMNASIWKHNLQKINQQFVQVLKEPVKEGTTLLLLARVSFSETYGISLQILDIDPSYTLGELQRERQETLLRLQKEGLLNKNQLVSFPLLPQRIAIISADTSKGLSDFMKVLNQNQFGYCFFTHLFFAYLQGDVAVTSISNQLLAIEKVKHHFDIVVIVRGGGGEVGLSCYNNYELCKAIANCSLPVLTGIGHSTNLTVAEMIAYRNAITPTELGEYLLQVFHEFSVPVERAVEKLKQLPKLILEQNNLVFNQSVKQLKLNVQNNLLTHHNKWQVISRKLNSRTELSIQRQQERLGFLKQNLSNFSKRLFVEKQNYLNDAALFLKQNTSKLLQKEGDEIVVLQRHVQLLDPKNVLKRGYSIARFNNKTIQAGNLPKEHEQIEIETYHYTIAAVSTAIKENKKE